VDLRVIDWKGVDRFDLHQDRHDWPVLTISVINFVSIKCGGFFD